MRNELEPLRRAALADAQAECERLESEAEETATRRLATAEREGAVLVERARREGAAAAELHAAHEHAEARRRARMLVLSAQRDVYEELRRQSLDEARALRDSASYNALVARLRRLARTQLGSGSHTTLAPDGGVLGTRDGRTVDYSLDALVERALARLGGSLAELWQ